VDKVSSLSSYFQLAVFEKYYRFYYYAFLPRDASAERGDATVSRLSVCLSVRP